METHMANFEGKTVIVTGGGGGIGGATSKRFAADGAKVAVFDMNVEAAQRSTKRGFPPRSVTLTWSRSSSRWSARLS